jgi:hypothetical protein
MKRRLTITAPLALILASSSAWTDRELQPSHCAVQLKAME